MSLPPPEANLRASVVVPAKDEEELIGRCIRSLASQRGVKPEEYEVLLVLDRCTDSTGERALEAALEYPELRLMLLEGPGLGAGHARRQGMETACERLMSLARPGALIASTDADTIVAPDWLERQLLAATDGARAIGGRIELLDDAGPSEEIRSWRDRRGKQRHLELLGQEKGAGPRVEHWQFSGASMSLTAEAYREVGGMEPLSALEDEQLESSLDRCDIPIQRPLDVRVSTSPRLVGRASRGLAKDLSLASWIQRNTYPDAPDIPTTGHNLTVSVIALSETNGEVFEPPGILGVNLDLIRVSIGGGDVPPTSRLGTVRGRGDALWRGLSRAEGELVALLPDLSRASLAAVPALIAPLLEREELELVKGYAPGSGGSELSRLVGVPLINLHYPDLAGFLDPLSPFVAARRSLLESLPFPAGAGVDASLLLDSAHMHGVFALAQAEIPHPPEHYSASPRDSYAIMHALLSRVGGLPHGSPSSIVIPDLSEASFDSEKAPVEERQPMSSFEKISTENC